MPRDHHHVGDAAETLAVIRFPAEGPWASLVIAGARGVRQEFYHPFAHYLAANGIHVVTFDYRGMGASRPSSLRGFRADVSSWAEKDLEEMLGRGDAKLPLLFVGHSLGGRLLGVPASNAQVRAAITVTAGFDRVKAPIRSYSFEDDPIITRPAVDSLHTFYRNARVERRHIDPALSPGGKIGHFGYFSPGSQPTLWAESLGWLRTAVEAA